MARRTFSNSEHATLTPDTSVQYYDAARWWPGTVVKGPHLDPMTGWECVTVQASSLHSLYVETGEHLDISPTKVRMPA